MNNKEAYFKNVPQIGDLYLDKILFEFDYEPIVFVCKNINNLRFLCVCDDVIERYSWIVSRISNKKLIEVIENRITVMSVFSCSKHKILVIDRDFDSDEYRYSFSFFKDIAADELPNEDQYLNMDGKFEDYVKTLKDDCISNNVDKVQAIRETKTKSSPIMKKNATKERNKRGGFAAFHRILGHQISFREGAYINRLNVEKKHGCLVKAYKGYDQNAALRRPRPFELKHSTQTKVGKITIKKRNAYKK